METINNATQFSKKLLSVKNLMHLYFKILNFLYMVQSSGRYYYFCDKYSTCPKEYTGKEYYKLCQMNNYYNDFEEKVRKLKHKKIELNSFANKLFNDINECVTIDPTVKKVFYGEYIFRGRDCYTRLQNVSLSETCKYWDELEVLNKDRDLDILFWRF